MQTTIRTDERATSRTATVQKSVEDRERRIRAARILESYEQLVWHSMIRNETVLHTRRHFEAIASGMKQGGDKEAVIEENLPMSDAYQWTGDAGKEGRRSGDPKRKRKSEGGSS